MEERIGERSRCATGRPTSARYHHLDAFRTFRGAHADLEAIPLRAARAAGQRGARLRLPPLRRVGDVAGDAAARPAAPAAPKGLQLGAWGVVEGSSVATLPR